LEVAHGWWQGQMRLAVRRALFRSISEKPGRGRRPLPEKRPAQFSKTETYR
jgi:hypothetical protein